MVPCQREGNLPSLTIAIILACCQAEHLTNIIKRKDWREPSHFVGDPARGARCNEGNGDSPRRVNTGALGLSDGREAEMAAANQAVGLAAREKFHVNTVEVEGIVTRVWDRKSDVFARLAVYDERAEILEPAKDGRLPRRQAHYVTLQFEGGKTADGAPVSLADRDRVRVSGYLRDSAYSESLREFLRKARKVDRIADGDDDVRVGRVATYVVAGTLVRFSR